MSFETIKVVLVGESGTGKTSIIQQFAYKIFDQDCATSISSQYITKVMTFPDINKNLRIEIWDTAGQERYRSMAKLFYKDAKIVIFVYDVTSKKSFDELIKYWIPEVQNTSDGSAIFGLVANKSDLYEIEAVSTEEGMNLADKIKAVFQKTSAKSGMGVNNLFNNLGKLYLQPDFDYKEGDLIEQENYNKKKMKENQNREADAESNPSVKIVNYNNKKQKRCC